MKKGIYRHYKGNYYEVLELGLHSETLEEVVIYRSINEPNKVWVRPLSMWNEEVICNGEVVKRFTLVNEKETKI